MIQKLFQLYDDSEYYIATNRKKLAYDNMSVIGGMLTFFVVTSFFFVMVAMAIVEDLMECIKYLPPVIIVFVISFMHKIIAKWLKPNFRAVRIYSMIIYTIVIMSFSAADMILYRNSRAVFFPAAILVISCVYMDRVGFMMSFKYILTIIFIVMESRFKTRQILINDAFVAVISVMASSFCYMTIVSNTLSRAEDNISLIKKSQTDLLTGLLNKVSFEEKCNEYLERKMNGAKSTLFIFDLDFFKEVNDSYGHAAGDKVISHFAELIKGYFHPDDIIGRIGGDEFMVLVLGEMPDGFAERRCRNVLHELKTSNIDGISGVSCSIGYVEETKRLTFAEMYKMADEALYEAKENGRGRAVKYHGQASSTKD